MSRVRNLPRNRRPLASDGSAPSSGVATWITTLAVCVLAAFLFASPGVVAQQQSPQPKVETEVTHQSQRLPIGAAL